MSRSFRVLLVCLWAFLGPGAQSQSTPPASADAQKVVARQIDINHASSSELKSVPGIGDAYANKIMAGRPYKNKSQLKSRGILPGNVYEKAKDYLVARQN
jgi:DNA uptake protein ComE-like DNA-binding protein